MTRREFPSKIVLKSLQGDEMNQTEITPNLLAVFRPGKHTATDGREIDFSEADCRQIVETYDPALHEAPFVIGHPSLTAPAYGWAGALSFADGLLYTEPKQVEPMFAEAFNAGRYKKRSVSVFMPDTPGNPTPGKYYLRHVGFLGAVPPAVKGLPDAQFSESTGGTPPAEFALPWETELLTDMLRSIREYVIERDGVERADQMLPAWRIRQIEELARAPDEPQPLAYSEESNVETENDNALAGRLAQLDAREQDLKRREDEQHQAQLAARRAEVTAFAETLATSGKILPRQKQPVIEMILALDSAPVSFADGSATVSRSPEEILREVLETKPAVLNFSEKSDPARTGEPVEFADPQALASAAQTYIAEQAKIGNTVSVTAAVAHVKGGKS